MVRGRVVDGDTGKPFAGVAVQLYPQPRGPYAPGIDSRPPTRSAITDADGVFTVERLAASDYSISAASPAEFLPGQKHITVADGAKVEITIRETRAATISGHVFDERGRPVVGAAVRVFAKDPSSFGSATTDDRGAYVIARLRAGRYAVGVPIWLSSRTLAAAPARTGSYQPPLAPFLLDRAQRTILMASGAPLPATSDDGRPQVYVTAFAGGGANSATAHYFDLGAGEARTDADITLAAVRGSRISGIVTAPSKIQGTILTLVPDGSRTSAEDGRMTATAAADGTFVFVAVPPGKYLLTAYRREPPLTEVTIAGGAPSLAMDDYTSNDVEDLWAELALGVGDADMDDLVVTMRQGTLLTGRIVIEDDPAYKWPPNQTPGILLAGSPRPYAFGDDRHLAIGRDGTISMRIRPGTYHVISRGPFQGRTFRTAIVNGIEIGDDPLIIGNDPLTDVQFVFTLYDTALRGTVKSANAGQPVDGNVVLFPADKARWFRLGESWLGRVMRAAEGRYEFTGIPPGDYYVTAIDNFQFGMSEQSVEKLVDGATRVTVRASAPVTVDLALRSVQ